MIRTKIQDSNREKHGFFAKFAKSCGKIGYYHADGRPTCYPHCFSTIKKHFEAVKKVSQVNAYEYFESSYQVYLAGLTEPQGSEPHRGVLRENNGSQSSLAQHGSEPNSNNAKGHAEHSLLRIEGQWETKVTRRFAQASTCTGVWVSR